MKSKLHRFFILALSFEMLVSSIGVAQVSHLCKLAISGMETISCHEIESDNHPCCEEETPGIGDNKKQDSCCTDEVKYFNNKVNGTIQEMFHSVPLDVVVITLLNPFDSIVENTFLPLFSNTIDYPPGETGRVIILSIQSLLI